MELDWVLVIGGFVNMSLSAGVGFNIGSFDKTIGMLSKDPLRYDQYEESMKNKKNNSTKDFLDYYVGMPGRFVAYKIFDNPNVWK
ncbi:MAG: hypothetical protein ABIE36_02995 [Candidatus Diapherotrites archaeon]